MENRIDILVSCVCITFNHREYISKCLDGMLMQDTLFPYEIIIYDDCSTDGTRDVVKKYEKKFPDKIKTVLPEENQYSKIGDRVREFYVHPIVRGKYIALCEGDDFWNNPKKLQLQVDFMESNPEYSICFHEFSTYNTKTGDFVKVSPYSISGEFDITADLLLNGKENICQPLTMMYRFSCWSPDWCTHYSRYCDTMENYHFLKVGKGRFLRFIGGQYNLHDGGVSAYNSDIKRSWEDIEDYQQMWAYTNDAVVLKKCFQSYLWRLDVCKRNKMFKDYWYAVWYAIKNNPKIGFKVFIKAIKRMFK